MWVLLSLGSASFSFYLFHFIYFCKILWLCFLILKMLSYSFCIFEQRFVTVCLAKQPARWNCEEVAIFTFLRPASYVYCGCNLFFLMFIATEPSFIYWGLFFFFLFTDLWDMVISIIQHLKSGEDKKSDLREKFSDLKKKKNITNTPSLCLFKWNVKRRYNDFSP